VTMTPGVGLIGAAYMGPVRHLDTSRSPILGTINVCVRVSVWAYACGERPYIYF